MSFAVDQDNKILTYTIPTINVLKEVRMVTQIHSKRTDAPETIALTEQEDETVILLIENGLGETYAILSEISTDITDPYTVDNTNIIVKMKLKEGYNSSFYPVWETHIKRMLSQFVLKEWFAMCNYEGPTGYDELKAALPELIRHRKKPN